MAAGIIQGTVTTTSGETIEMSWLVDDTGTPTKWYNASHIVNSAGAGGAFGAGNVGTTVLRITRAADDVDVGSGTGGTKTQRVIVDSTQLAALNTTAKVMADNFQLVGLPTDDAAVVSLALLDDVIKTDDAAFTPATSKVSMVGFQADETATDSVDEGDAGAARMTLDRKVIVTPEPHTAGGLSIFRSIDLDEGTLEVVKASAGQIYGMWVTNTATATRFIKIYDAASGTAGTGTPVITIGIPGNSSDDVSGLFSSTHGIAFATGISIGAVTGVADNDTGAPGANEVIVNVFYK